MRIIIKNWSNNGNTILTYNTIVKNAHTRLWTNSNIKTTAMWRDFYSVVRDNSVVDWFERRMQRFEEPAKRSIDKVFRDELVTREDLSIIAGFLVAQMVRTPGWFLRTSKEYANIFDKAIQATYQRIEDEQQAGILQASILSTKEELRSTPENPLQLPLKISPVEGDNVLKVEGYMGRDAFLYFAEGILDGEVYKTLLDYPWKVFTTPPGVSLLKSDNPVVLYGRQHNGGMSFTAGISQRNANIFLPLSPHHLFFTEVGISEAELEAFQMPDNMWSEIQEAIIHNATRYIYANVEYTNIESVRPRNTNPDYYNDLLCQQKEWNNEQLAEQEYFPLR